MKCLRNPTSGKVKRVSDLEASRLARYGWRYISKSEFKRGVVETSLDRARLRLDPKGREVANGSLARS